MDWRESKGLMLLATALLVAASLGVPPSAVRGADSTPERIPFLAEEKDGLCRKFRLGGLGFHVPERAKDADHLLCEVFAPAAKGGFVGQISMELYPSDEAAHTSWRVAYGPNDEVFRHEPTDSDHRLFNYFPYKNGTVQISLWGLDTADRGQIDTLARTARSIIDGKAPPATKYKTSIDYDTTPFQATITVRDAEGDPVADKSVQVTAYIDKMQDHFFVYREDGTLRDQSVEPIGYAIFELLAPVPAGAQPPQREIDQRRRWRTDERGTITVTLYHFDAVEVGGSITHGYLLAGGALPVSFTVRADLVEKDGSGVERTLTTSHIPVKLDHVAKLVDVRYRADSPGTVWIRRSDLKEDVSRADVRAGGAYPTGFELRHGDVIEQTELVGTSLKWFNDIQLSMWVLRGRGPQDITVYASDTSAHEDIGFWQSVGLYIAAGGVMIAVATPAKPVGIVQAVAGIVFAVFAPEEIVGVDLVPHSVVLTDVTDNIAIYTIEGRVEAYDRASSSMAEVTAGQTVTLHPDTSFGPVTAFQLSELDEEMLRLVGSIAPESVPQALVDSTPEPEERPGIEETIEAAVFFADDFDDENDGSGMLDYDGFAQWTVDAGTVDLLGDGLFDFYPDAGLFLDLDGSRDARGTLVAKETFALTPGRYRLEFDLAGHPFSGPDTVTVALGEHLVEDFTMPHDPDMSGFERIVRDITVDRASEARLSFRQHGADNLGLLLDNVRLSRLPDGETEVDETTPPATAVPATPTPEPPTRTPVEPTPSLIAEPSVPTAVRDLWLHEGDTVTRVDHLSGEVLERWDVSHPDCPSGHGGRPLVQIDGEAAWLPVADAQWETPVLECLMRLPLDGAAGLETYPVPTGRKPTFIHDAATQGDDLWAITWKKQDPGGTLEYYDDWSLARLDLWTGALTKVLPRVVALAPTKAGLVVLYSEQGGKKGARRPLRLGIVEPGGKAPREIPFDAALPRTRKGTYITPRLRLSAGHGGTVALYDEYAGRDIVVFDPASGVVVGRIAPPEGATAIGRVSPVSAGVWMSGLLEGGADFVRYVPFDGWTSLVVDPCTDVVGDCYAQVETASDAGAWVSAWPYDGAFEVVLDRVVMRRYDTGGQGLSEVTGAELFGSR